ncbi:5-dehydro-4-deoxy-D-glucuronate isomerase [Terrimonas ferruginea]|uniref:5-dehydro-4-deoxy-D-glucuronate isomerase n=1 Tax=Terrimonas ferruginea TaxID=249 RepID=UPI00040A39CD|nr:5-dehydro-4-deoxy-D-glucuronate isomerase [Terrimonas ferruginea]
MKIIHQVHPEDFVRYTTQQIRDRFLLESLVVADKIECAYTHYDRMIVGAAYPVKGSLKLGTYDQLKSENFLDRREIGIINIAGNGRITVDGEAYDLEKQDCLYIGKGKKNITFESAAADAPAKFIFFSCPAHKECPTRLMKPAEALPAELGSLDNNNHRTINKYIHMDGIESCQLVLGVTTFKKGSIWNTMPAHLHDRRMESYFYFDLPEGQRIIHFMGQPHETRHIFLNNEQAILSPSWSIHSGTATASYSFIWAMAGENMAFTDMDPVNVQELQ